MSGLVEQRKREHVELAAHTDVASSASSGLNDVHLVHEALPEVDLDAIDTTVELLGRRLRLPLVISAMTGGYAEGGRINATLGRAAERHGLAMGVGSQRAALVDPGLGETYRAAREAAPGAFLMANVGIAQLVAQPGNPALEPGQVETLIGMIRADALAVHLNATQELIQPEGDRNASGWLRAIEDVAARIDVPLIAKETGAGMSAATARRLGEAGAAALDVGGIGGTSFAAIERARAELRRDARGVLLGGLLRDWGIPTAVSIMQACTSGVPVIGTGGVRSGLDAARALALGATAVGVARPLLQAALEEDADEAVDRWVEDFGLSLRGAMFLTGSHDAAALRRVPRVVTGLTGEWLRQLDAARW